MPFMGYETFQICVSDQMKKHAGQKGFKEENARKICGYLQAKAEGTKK